MAGRRKGKVVVTHLAGRYPFAGVMWQLLHHLIGLRRLGLDVYYLEDNGGVWVLDPIANLQSGDYAANVNLLASALERHGFKDRWSFFFDWDRKQYAGMDPARALALAAEADAVINLCGATRPRDEFLKSRCRVYLETDPGDTAAREPELVGAHQVHFTYAYNIGAPDCALPTAGITWRRTRPPVLLDQWNPQSVSPEPAVFTTVCTWENKGKDIDIAGETYHWSKHFNFRKVLEVPKRAGQKMELATDLACGPDYERALAGGFSIKPAVPLTLDLDGYHDYIASSRGEFTATKDSVVRTRSGWFSDRSVCYLAAGRPVITQRTGFEKFIPTGVGLLGFDDADEAVEAVREVNRDYARHSRAAREIACEHFDALKLLDEIAESAGL
jgi:hypothetical protein